MDEKGFRQMSFRQRFEELQAKGEHVSSRIFGGYEVHLYLYEGLYIEVWRYIAFRQIIWIEPLTNPAAWNEYLEGLDLPDDIDPNS